MCISLGAKTDRNDTLCPYRQHYVALAYDRNDTIMSFWISANVAIVKLSLRPLFAPKEMRPYGHLWDKHQYFS